MGIVGYCIHKNLSDLTTQVSKCVYLICILKQTLLSRTVLYNFFCKYVNTPSSGLQYCVYLTKPYKL